MRRGAKLDWELIERELTPLLAVQGGQPVWDHLDELRQKLSTGGG
jgi:hypothetical protein